MPDPPLRRKICNYLSRLYPLKKAMFFHGLLPQTMPSWGEVRIAHAGGHIRTRQAQERITGDLRDASFVRVLYLILSLAFSVLVLLEAYGFFKSIV